MHSENTINDTYILRDARNRRFAVISVIQVKLRCTLMRPEGHLSGKAAANLRSRSFTENAKAALAKQEELKKREAERKDHEENLMGALLFTVLSIPCSPAAGAT